MGEVNKNGVGAAIALICELARHSRPTPMAELARAVGLPRSSFYRIVRTLAESGILTTARGKVAAGQLASRLAFAQPNLLSQDHERLRPRTNRQRRGQTLLPVSTGLIALSPPLRARRSRRFHIGFSNASMDNAWRFALVHAVEYATASFGEDIGQLVVRHAHDSGPRQSCDIHKLIDDGVDGLVVSAVDASLIAEPLERAHRVGIPVVLVDRCVAPGMPHQSLIWADNEAIGHLHALWLCEKLGGQGSILMLGGREEAVPAIRRLAAARRVVAQFPGIEVILTAWSNWKREVGRSIVSEAISRHGSRIAGVWCDSGLQGAGSIEAFIAAGIRPGLIPPHTGGDLNLVYKLAIRHRVPLAAVDYPPAMGAAAVEILHACLRGDWVPQTLHVASETILTRGHSTRSVKASLYAEDHVRWDLPDDLVLASGLGPGYNPRRFRIHYPGNRYNRSAANAPERTV